MFSTINIIINDNKKLQNHRFQMGTFSYDSLKNWLLPAVGTASEMHEATNATKRGYRDHLRPRSLLSVLV